MISTPEDTDSFDCFFTLDLEFNSNSAVLFQFLARGERPHPKHIPDHPFFSLDFMQMFTGCSLDSEFLGDTLNSCFHTNQGYGGLRTGLILRSCVSDKRLPWLFLDWVKDELAISMIKPKLHMIGYVRRESDPWPHIVQLDLDCVAYDLREPSIKVYTSHSSTRPMTFTLQELVEESVRELVTAAV